MGGLPVRFLITGYALLLSMQVASATAMNDWLIVPGVSAGPITAATTRADLDRVFGAKNVTDMDVTVSDEGSTPGTVVYLSNLARCLTILWANDKPGSPVGSLVFCLGQTADAPARKGCEWHTREGAAGVRARLAWILARGHFRSPNMQLTLGVPRWAERSIRLPLLLTRLESRYGQPKKLPALGDSVY